MRGGVELFNNMLQVLRCCYDQLEKHDKILEQLQEVRTKFISWFWFGLVGVLVLVFGKAFPFSFYPINKLIIIIIIKTPKT